MSYSETSSNNNNNNNNKEEDLTKVIPIPLESLDDLDYLSTTPTITSTNNPNEIVDNVEDEDEDDEYNNKKKSRTNWIIPTLYRVQKYSAYSFLSFLGIHATSVIIVPILPIDTSIKEEIFAMAKAVYQSLPMYESGFIIGAVSAHLISGIGLRLYRKFFHRFSHKHHNHNTNQLNDKNRLLNKKKRQELGKISDDDDEIGFGGLANLFGLGYTKSFTVRLFSLTPLQFSGYLLIPFVLYHFYKFRYIPWSIEGDSALINLEYITYVLNLKHPIWNSIALGGLVWIMAYHSTNGFMKLQWKFSKWWKKIGLIIVNGIGILGMVAIYWAKSNKSVLDVNGFLGKSFAKYLNSFWV